TRTRQLEQFARALQVAARLLRVAQEQLEVSVFVVHLRLDDRKQLEHPREVDGLLEEHEAILVTLFAAKPAEQRADLHETPREVVGHGELLRPPDFLLRLEEAPLPEVEPRKVEADEHLEPRVGGGAVRPRERLAIRARRSRREAEIGLEQSLRQEHARHLVRIAERLEPFARLLQRVVREGEVALTPREFARPVMQLRRAPLIAAGV